MKKIVALLCALVLILCMTSCSNIFFEIDDIRDLFNMSFSSLTETAEPIPSDSQAPETQPVNTEVLDTSDQSNEQNNTPPSSSNTTDPQFPNYPAAPSLDGIDYVTLINTITTDTIKACVNIRTDEFTSKNDTTPNKSSIGSGVIFYGYELKNGNEVVGYHYYVLTNYHVVELSDVYPYYYYTIEDYQGVKYGATASWINDDDIITLCKNNDLAILEFESAVELKVIEMEIENPVDNETLISIGQPEGQRNAITIGTAEGYGDVAKLNMYNVLVHDAPIDHGNSGGAIINTDHKLIGINFAGLFEDNGDFKYGYGIPIETVLGFINDFDPFLYADLTASSNSNAA